MAEFYRGSDLEPTRDDLIALVQKSGPSEWLLDDETGVFTHRQNLLVFLVPTNDDSYSLQYGYMDLCSVPNAFMREHVGLRPKESTVERARAAAY